MFEVAYYWISSVYNILIFVSRIRGETIPVNALISAVFLKENIQLKDAVGVRRLVQ
jgi:hypothetical protein